VSASRPEPGTEPWLRRYARQIVLAGIGEEGQRRLGEGCVLVVGTGEAAVACAVHLAAAGVGRVLSADAAVAGALARLSGAPAEPGCGVPDVVVLMGGVDAPREAATGAVLVEGDGAGGAIVRASKGAAGARRELSAALPIARAAGALAADAAMRSLLGAPPAAGVAIRADASVGPVQRPATRSTPA
jgi:hypothetical protein